MNVRSIIAFAVAITASTPGFSSQPAASIPADLQKFAEETVAAVRGKDVERVISFYDHSDAFVAIEDGVTKHWPQLERDMRQFMAAVKDNNLQWQGTPNVVMLRDDLAVIYGRHTFSGTMASGQILPSHEGVWSGVVRKTAKGWKIIHSHSSATR